MNGIMKYFFLLIFLFPLIAFTQNEKQQLEQDKKKIEQEIQYTNTLLEQTRKNKSASLNELVILENKISKQENLIITMNREMKWIDQQIEIANDSIEVLNDDLERLRDEYAEMIYFAYKNKNLYNRLMFVFASEDFNQAYQRIKYFQQYNAYRKKQAELIIETQQLLQKKTQDLAQNRKDKEVLLQEQREEREKLTDQKQTKDKTVQQLNQTEQDLKKSLKEKEQAAQELQSALEAIIAEEIRLANERAAANADRTKGMALTPEEVRLSDDFMSNKGKLPWPLERGVISSTFGEHQHPVLKKVKVKNNGIDILTESGSEARAVFEGEVTRVMSVPNNNNVVIIRHGEYLTVYSNLDEVFVRQGDKVSTKQSIGTVFTNPDESKTELHFEVWRAKTLMNPSPWLAR